MTCRRGLGLGGLQLDDDAHGPRELFGDLTYGAGPETGL